MGTSKPTAETARLSAEVCRHLLGRAAEGLSAPELENLRDQLYGMAQVIVGTIPKEGVAAQDAEERAAIREYDGGLSREQAETAAVIDIVTGRSR